MPFMARIIGFLMAIILLGAANACSPKPVGHAETQPGLDRLFQQLHTTTNPVEARLIEATIRHVWSHSNQPEVERMMKWASAALHGGDLPTAFHLLDQIVVKAPDLVAAWNMRATLHYAQDDYAAALADIAVTLTLEPRHFGAWAGLGLIMQDMGQERAALRAFETALSLNPHLDDLRDDVSQLRNQVIGLAL